MSRTPEPLSQEEIDRIDLRAMLDHHEQLARQIGELALGAQTTRAELIETRGRLAAVEAELKTNTDITSEVRDLLGTFRSGFKVLGWLGTGATWLGRIAAAALAIWGVAYTITHHGELPPHK